MIVKERKRIEFINDCNCIVDVTELENAINWYSEQPTVRLKKIFMHGRYPAVSIYREKIHVHRLLVMYWNKRRLKREEYVHHKDGNKMNADKRNLEIVESSMHQSLHNKGRKFSEEHKRKLGEANRKRKGMKYNIQK